MSAFPQWLNQSVYRKAQEYEKTYLEQQRKIKEKADRYDKLINMIGHQEFMEVMVSKVNSEISEATKYPLEPERQRVHVIRWNAMREVIDAAMGDIEYIRKERDRLNEEEREFLATRMYQNIQGEEHGERNNPADDRN